MRLLVAVLAVIALAACDDGHLRGAESKSSDGKTYLSVVDDNGGKCGPLKVDGVVWPHPIGKVVPFRPGNNTISCGAEIVFTSSNWRHIQVQLFGAVAVRLPVQQANINCKGRGGLTVSRPSRL